jgi:Domain of unknown function (DUF2760)
MQEPAIPLLARLWLALVCLVRVVFDPDFASRVAQARALPAPPAPKELAPQQPAVGAEAATALHLLAHLQREGRFVDFCQEELAGFTDAEVGAAARTVHSGCRKVVREMLDLHPILGEAEGAPVVVSDGFDPSAIRLTGNVIGNPPFHGTLRHHGWKVATARVSPPAAGQDPTVLAPAEVELP